jgi:hypothetical protein
MSAALKLEPAGGVHEEVERLQDIFSTGFFRPKEAAPLNSTQQAADLPFPQASGAPDWTQTLGNIRQLIQARKAAEARLVVAEERARSAEARAAEAEHWLRRLHKAVLEGLPGAKAST